MYRKTARNNKMKNRKRMRNQYIFFGGRVKGSIVEITNENKDEKMKTAIKYIVYQKSNMNNVFRELTNSDTDKQLLMTYLNEPELYTVYANIP
jgi:hypothetical protein